MEKQIPCKILVSFVVGRKVKTDFAIYYDLLKTQQNHQAPAN